MTNKIDKYDVNEIGSFLSVELTDEQVNQIIENYNDEQEKDPMATWDLVVEKMIDNIPDEEKKKVFNFYLDQKVTTWYRTKFKVSGKTLEEAKEQAKTFYETGNCYEIPWEQCDVAPEIMIPEENGGQSTEELYYTDGELILENGII